MAFLYQLGIHIFSAVLKLLAHFNHKIKQGVLGRKQTFKKLESLLTKTDKTLWFHCASLGEYEQGLPVFQHLRSVYPDHKIVLTFFSPSGYEIRKNTAVADVVVYLPLDTKKNARRFVNLVHPDFTVFVKYDIWPNLLFELQSQRRRAILISASFRKQQSYFSIFGGKRKAALMTFEHIFVQNESSKVLLNGIGYHAVTVSGDTRYDRVSHQLMQDNTLDFISEFKGNSTCIVIGSSWPEDEALFYDYINNHASEGLKFIVAPHEIKPNHITNIQSNLTVRTALYSKKDTQHLKDAVVFIIDTIGLLSSIYSYADIAYVGGAMGTSGLHNILEPAVFGIPVIIGKNYSKFPEATDMISHAGVISIKNKDELTATLNSLKSSDKQHILGLKNAEFIEKKQGAVVQIINYIRI